ncbi:MAG: (d)CMP kinase [Deltaproteobacteria bacterium]|nr:(d)CMP kinase [Deltaproteobacteria bacterium]MDQ3296331.1 (d)CMP kinase [Myxococcota bacterium]
MKKCVVTIDGPAGAGKSSVAKLLARRLAYRLLDTGAIYRAVALTAKLRGVPWTDGAACATIARDLDIRFDFVADKNHVYLAGSDVTSDIRTPDISQGASQVSAHPQVRAALLDLQRRLGAGGGVVVEGRDTGTVVFPQADAKFFLTATEGERARRRVSELAASGTVVDYEVTLREIQERDQRDAGRDVAPMVPALDAVLVDSSAQTLEEVVDSLAAQVQARAAGHVPGRPPSHGNDR